MKLLDQTIVRDSVDYSFGDESGIETLMGYMKIANSTNEDFISKYWQLMNTGKRYMTLFIDNIRLYRMLS